MCKRLNIKLGLAFDVWIIFLAMITIFLKTRVGISCGGVLFFGCPLQKGVAPPLLRICISIIFHHWTTGYVYYFDSASIKSYLLCFICFCLILPFVPSSVEAERLANVKKTQKFWSDLCCWRGCRHVQVLQSDRPEMKPHISDLFLLMFVMMMQPRRLKLTRLYEFLFGPLNRWNP